MKSNETSNPALHRELLMAEHRAENARLEAMLMNEQISYRRTGHHDYDDWSMGRTLGKGLFWFIVGIIILVLAI